MNSRAYILDPNAAKAADQINARITETGKYIGRIVSAEAVTSKQGSQGIELSFKASDGGTADFLTLWTHNQEGKELFGLKTLNAIMACLTLRGISPQAGHVEKWDDATKSRIKVQATVFPDLCAPIGLLLQREEYLKSDNSVGAKMNIFAPFQANTDLTAGEIMNRVTKPETLAKMVAQLKDKPLKNKPQSPAQAPSHYDSAYSAGAGGHPAFDEGIPFAPIARGIAGHAV